MVIIVLLALFISRLHNDPFWRNYGYWVTLALMIVFATGGAVIRTKGGNISLVTLTMIFVAARINAKELRKEKVVIYN